MRLCLDSSIYISWLKHEQPGTPCSDGIADIIRVLDSADNQKDPQYQLMISTITLAEVFKDTGYVKEFSKFEKMIDIYEVIPVDQKIAILARDIGYQFQVSPRDAIHVATSLHKKADYLCAKDRGMLKLENDTNFAKFSKEYSGKRLNVIEPPLPTLGI